MVCLAADGSAADLLADALVGGVIVGNGGAGTLSESSSVVVAEDGL